MFTGLADRLSGVFDKLTRRGILTESAVDETMREIKIALIEADVALPVIKDFIAHVREKAVGEQIVFKESANESRDAYFHPCVHNGQLWVLYSGKYFGKSETPIYLNNRILVFDAQGVPQKQYVLDIPIFAFTINESRNTIYGITEHPEMEIVEFKIP